MFRDGVWKKLTVVGDEAATDARPSETATAETKVAARFTATFSPIRHGTLVE